MKASSTASAARARSRTPISGAWRSRPTLPGAVIIPLLRLLEPLSELSAIANASGLDWTQLTLRQAAHLRYQSRPEPHAGQEQHAPRAFAEEYEPHTREPHKGFGRYASRLYVLDKAARRRPVVLACDRAEPERVRTLPSVHRRTAVTEYERLQMYGMGALGAYPTTFVLESTASSTFALEADKDFALGDLCSVHAYGQVTPCPFIHRGNTGPRRVPSPTGFGRPVPAP